MAHFTGIGHLHLKLADIERAARFMSKALERNAGPSNMTPG
jgi:catechol-2,3-dioxygenase